MRSLRIRVAVLLVPALVIPALGTLFLGIFPAWVLDFAGKSSALVR